MFDWTIYRRTSAFTRCCFTLKLFLWESIIVLLPSHLHGLHDCKIIARLPLRLYAIHHTILVKESLVKAKTYQVSVGLLARAACSRCRAACARALKLYTDLDIYDRLKHLQTYLGWLILYTDLDLDVRLNHLETYLGWEHLRARAVG